MEKSNLLFDHYHLLLIESYSKQINNMNDYKALLDAVAGMHAGERGTMVCILHYCIYLYYSLYKICHLFVLYNIIVYEYHWRTIR